MASGIAAGTAGDAGLPLCARSDDWLARQVGRSRPDPFHVLFERHWSALRGHCLAILRVPDQAEEAAQEAMSRAYGALLAKGPPAAFRPWLFGIARNAAIDLLRQRARAGATPEDELQAGGGVAEEMEVRHELDLLLSELRALPRRQRKALAMREMGDRSHHEIGQALGIEPARSKMLVSEARQTLRERRKGREADCAELRSEVQAFRRRRVRGHRLSAHLEVCPECRRTAARRMLGALPLPFAGIFAGGRAVLARAAHRLRQLVADCGVSGAGAGAAVSAGAAVVASAVTLAAVTGGEHASPPRDATSSHQVVASRPAGTAERSGAATERARAARVPTARTGRAIAQGNAAHGRTAASAAPWARAPWPPTFLLSDLTRQVNAALMPVLRSKLVTALVDGVQTALARQKTRVAGVDPVRAVREQRVPGALVGRVLPQRRGQPRPQAGTAPPETGTPGTQARRRPASPGPLPRAAPPAPSVPRIEQPPVGLPIDPLGLRD